MLETNYLIEGPKDKVNNVKLWSRIRLPFEPKGWLLDMRNLLRSQIKQIQNTENIILHALYVSDEAGYFDVENVLIYNLGSGSFSNLCRSGLCFERVFASPPQPAGVISSFSHYHQYSLIDSAEGSLQWTKEHRLASWTGVSCPPLRGENKPHSFWYAMKNGAVVVIDKLKIPRYLGLELKISAPIGTKINLAAAIKPLLDGIISGFHSHDGTHNSIVVKRVAHSLGEKESIIEHLLLDQSTEVLGRRNLLHPFGNGVQWNPADDLCVMTKVVVNDCIEGSGWCLDGEIYTVVPCRN